MNPVLYWNAVLLEASRRDFTRGFNNAQQPGPIRTSRAMAIVHLAIHDVVAYRVNPAATYIQKKGIVPNPPIVVPGGGDISDMIAGAAVTTIKALYPNYAGFVDDSLGTVNQADFDFGVAVGRAMLAARANDGSDVMLTRNQPGSPVYGDHRADPYQSNQNQLGPKWGDVVRFLGAAHKPLDAYPGHGQVPLLNDAHYQQDFVEVRDFGAAERRSRTPEQQRIGVYWGYDGANNLGVPPRLYNQVARRIVASKPAMPLAQTAEIFALVNVAMADAGIDAWHHKYLNNLWRPVVGVRAEPAPIGGDAFWAPLGAPQTNVSGTAHYTPNFPAYPSGHATFGAALFQVLRLTFNKAAGPLTVQQVMDAASGAAGGSTAETFAFVSDELDGISTDPDGSTRQRVEKTFSSFAEAVWENAVSRVYLGVHWRFDGLPREAAQNVGGVPLGLAIGQEAHSFFNTGQSLVGSA